MTFNTWGQYEIESAHGWFDYVMYMYIFVRFSFSGSVRPDLHHDSPVLFLHPVGFVTLLELF